MGRSDRWKISAQARRGSRVSRGPLRRPAGRNAAASLLDSEAGRSAGGKKAVSVTVRGRAPGLQPATCTPRQPASQQAETAASSDRAGRLNAALRKYPAAAGRPAAGGLN